MTKSFVISFLLSSFVEANPLICHPPDVFPETISVQVDHVPVGSVVYLEKFVPGELADLWVEVSHIDNTTDEQVVFILPRTLNTQQIYRAYYK
jgi:hypothetical protein